MEKKIGIIGAGSWGTALAQAMAEGGGREVVLWGRNAGVVDSVTKKHENSLYLPGVPLHANIRATGDMDEAAACPVLLIVTPAQHVRSTLALVKKSGGGGALVICAKGIELGTGKMMVDVAREEMPDSVPAILSGPTFAAEIGRGLPSAATLACTDRAAGEALCEALASRSLRPYFSDDVVGAQVGGAVKNVIAIACGIVTGHGFGESARAALMTRGLAEMARLSASLGGRRETLMGMCGVGDLVLTCSSLQSRNYSLGMEMGEGRKMADILARRRSVTEGVHTAKALSVMAARQGVDMPVSAVVNRCLNEGLPIENAIAAMLDRPLRVEGV